MMARRWLSKELKEKRDLKIVRLRDASGLTWTQIAASIGLSLSQCLKLYQQRKGLRDESGKVVRP